MRAREIAGALAATAVLSVSGPAAAQQRPLVTEDPETVGEGLLLVEAGVDHDRDRRYVVSGLGGHLTSFPRLGISVGLSPIAEFQLDGMSINRLQITRRVPAPLSGMLQVDGDRAESFEDLVVGMKVRLIRERTVRPGIGFRFATKLPNAGNEDGLGLDTTDFFGSVLAGKTIRSTRFVFNLGLAILSDPTRGDRQNTTPTYGFSVAHAIARGVEIVGEMAGRTNVRRGAPPPGTGSAGAARLGGRITRGPVRLDAALLYGLTPNEGSVGATVGFTWVFRAFTLQ